MARSIFASRNRWRTYRRLLIGVTAAAIVFGSLAFTGNNADAQVRRTRGFSKLPLRGQSGSFVIGEIVVSPKAGTDPAQLAAALSNAGLEVVRPLLLKPFVLVKVTPVGGAAVTEQMTTNAVDKLKATNFYNTVAPNWKVWKFDTTPNDPRYAQQWQYPLMNMPKAWDFGTSLTSNTIICSLDTGVDINHPEFAGNRFVGTRNFTVTPNTTDVTDVDGHGTHTTGTMTANGNNGVGVSGTTWGGSIFVGKVLGDTGSGSIAGIADGITYIADNVKTLNNNVVINMSLGSYVLDDTPDLSDPMEAACVYAATQKNVVISMSAGNAFDQGNPAAAPARTAQLDNRLFCIAAVGTVKEHSFYSNARAYTTIAAPGGDDPSFANNALQILSTLPVNQGGYGYEQGTSMASPHVAGALALLLSFGATQDQLKQIVTSSADTVGLPVPNNQYGYGVIDVYAAALLVKSGIQIIAPVDSAYVYGTTQVILGVGSPAVFTRADVTIDKDPAIVGTTSNGSYQVSWNTQATDPVTGAPMYPNGAHKVNITIYTTNSPPVTISKSVRVDNPVATVITPGSLSYLTKSVNIIGTADGLRIPTYKLEYALVTNPSTFITIAPSTKGKVTGASLGSWDLAQLPDGNVYLKLTVTNPDGFSNSQTVLITIDQTQPSTPNGLSGVSSNRSAALTWNASTDPPPGKLAGYNVYRSGKSLTGYTKINSSVVANPTFSDGSLINSSTYFYKVTAVDSAGNESSQSSFISVTPNRNGTTNGSVIALDGTFVGGAVVNVLQNSVVVPNGTATTSSSGTYAYGSPPGFAPGTYDISIAKAGFVPQIMKGFAVDLGIDAPNQNFALQAQPVLPSGWSTLTLPYNFYGADIATVFSGASVKWYSPATGTYLNPTDTGFPSPAPGIAYWVNPTGTASVNVAGTPNSPKTPVSIPIHIGWNLLGNPFQDPISWVLNNLIVQRSDNGQQASVTVAVTQGWTLDYAWGGPTGHTLIYDRTVVPGVNNTIPGYGAFWFYSTVEGSLSIAPPAITSRVTSSPNLSNWIAEIKASTNSNSASVYIGSAKTRRTFSSAPSVDANPVSISLSSDATTTTAVDLRPQGINQSWDVTVNGPADQPVTITWPGLNSLPRGWSVALVDKSNNSRVNLRTSSSYTTSAGRGVRNLSLELTRDSGQRMVVTDISVNTTRSTAPFISFNVGADGQATVSVLKANGDSVRTITTRAVKAGQNITVWDTRDNLGRNVAPGVYLIQVKATGSNGDTARAVASFVIIR